MMKKPRNQDRSIRKLTIQRDTVAQLTELELGQVVGGNLNKAPIQTVPRCL